MEFNYKHKYNISDYDIVQIVNLLHATFWYTCLSSPNGEWPTAICRQAHEWWILQINFSIGLVANFTPTFLSSKL